MSTRRRSSGSISLGTVTQLATLKPNPPETPRGSLLLDITNGGGGSEAEMQRLSAQALDLMAKMRLRDDEIKRLENVVSTLQKEVSNLTVRRRAIAQRVWRGHIRAGGAAAAVRTGVLGSRRAGRVARAARTAVPVGRVPAAAAPCNPPRDARRHVTRATT